MKLLIINGPNINMLGIREPGIYGSESYDTLLQMIKRRGEELDIVTECFQSNHEGDIVDRLQDAYFEAVDGIVINPAAYTHTSVAIADALKAISIPAVEVHISDVNSREEFRRVSYVRAAVIAVISGHGLGGYLEAMDLLAKRLSGACDK